MSKHTYRLRYSLKIEAGEFKKQDIPPGDGAADALMLCSILYPPDGSYSLQIVGKDGRTGEPLSDREKFKVWATMCAGMAHNAKELLPWQKYLMEMTADMIRVSIGVDKRRESAQ